MTDLSPQRWLRVKEVFAVVAASSSAERDWLLDELCRDDESLRAEVDSLLLAHDSATRDGWLRGPLVPQHGPEFEGNGRFQVEARLGEGGFGIVYRVLDQELGRRVALKLLRRADAAALVLFKHEFRVLVDRAHPNLVRLHDLYLEEGQAFFTMELVEGKPLTHLSAAREGTGSESVGRSIPALVALFGQLAEGVCALHADRLLHRDLKPENVLVTPAGRVVILDFGLATDADLSDHVDAQRRGCGTPAYMAPEQFLGAGASQASDWYSVGVMLYEAIAGRLPYQGDLAALRQAKLVGSAPALPPSGMPALDVLCLDLLRPSPTDRPTGAEVRRVLSACAGHSAVAAAAAVTADLADAALLVRSRMVAAGAGAAFSGPLFVARQAQLAALRDAFEITSGGTLRVVSVSGRSGMGKTALCRRFLETLGTATADSGPGSSPSPLPPLILAGRCHEREALGFKALDGTVDELSRVLRRCSPADLRLLLPPNIEDLARLFPALLQVPPIRDAARSTADDVDTVEQRRRAFEALRELLRRLAARQPVVLFIDDLQWGDSDSAALLRQVLRPPLGPPVLLLVAFRQEDDAVAPVLDQLLEALRASTQVADVVVNALAPEEARAFAVSLLGADHAALDGVVREAGGVPFFVSALVDRVREGSGALSSLGRHVSMDAVLVDSVSRLPDNARRLLDLVALSGKPVRRDIVRDAAGLSPSADDDAEHVLRVRRLIRPSADGLSLETYHDRFRTAIAAALLPAQVPGMHRRLAQAMAAAAKVHPEDVAHHLHAAGDVLAAADYAVRGAEQWAAALAFDRAAALYKMALASRGSEHDTAPSLLLSMADALANAGRAADAGEAYLTAANSIESRRLELMCKGGTQLLRAGDMTRGPTIMADVLRALNVHAPITTGGLVAAVLLRRARLWFRGLGSDTANTAPPAATMVAGAAPDVGATRRALRMDASWALATSTSTIYTAYAFYLQTRHLDWALDEKEPFRLGRALALESVHASLGGSRTAIRAAGIVRLARQVVDRARLPVLDGILAVAEAAAAFNAGRWRTSFERSATAIQILNRHSAGVAWELAMAGTFVLGSLAVLGDLRQYEARLVDLVHQAKSRGDVYAEAMLVLATQPQGHYLARDRPDEALRAIEAARQRFDDGRFKMPDVWALVAKIDIALYQGAASTAWELVTGRGRRPGGPGLLARDWLLAQVQIVRIVFHQLRGRAALALAVDDRKRKRALLKVAAAAARAIEREGASWAHGLALLLRASVAQMSGSEGRVASLLEAARTSLDESEMGIHAAVARRLWAERASGSAAARAAGEAEAWMAAQGILRPERFVDALAPGLRR